MLSSPAALASLSIADYTRYAHEGSVCEWVSALKRRPLHSLHRVRFCWEDIYEYEVEVVRGKEEGVDQFLGRVLEIVTADML